MAANEVPNKASGSEEQISDNVIPNWDDYFMGIAFMCSKRSKDPLTKVGACIVDNDKRIISTGYNDMPNRCPDGTLPWTKGKPKNPFNSKSFYVCHAELNAILNNNTTSVKDCTMYVNLFPCNECAKMIIQSGIKEVVYVSDKQFEKDTTIASKRMLTSAGVETRMPERKITKFYIDFDEIDRYQKKRKYSFD